MKSHAWFRAAVAVLVVGLEIVAASAAQEGPFRPLFNGRDLSGWVNVNCAPGTWQTSGSVVSCTGVPTGMLRTERMYRNFILDVEWRHLKPKGNGGIFVWADPLPARGQPFVRGVEVQVLDGQEGSWFTSDGDIFPVHGARMVPENGRGGDRAFPTEKRVRPSPEWNHYRIHCQDGTISLAVNGTVVTRGHSASPRKGYICLESEGSPTEFRNVRIRELPAGEALSPDQIAATAEEFRPLYNGLDLAGWSGNAEAPSHWKAADWILECDGRKGIGDPSLRTEKEYGDIQLIVDWRRPEKKGEPGAGNGGIFLRRADRSLVRIGEPEDRAGEVRGNREDTVLSGTVRNEAALWKNAERPAGEWNRFLITLRGNRLDVVLNGETVMENVLIPGLPERGPIGLQYSGGPIQFANILVRELD